MSKPYISDTIEFKTIFGTYRMQIVSDDDAEDPRGWDNLGTMICWHGRYNLGDSEESKRYDGHESFMADLAGIDYSELFDRIYDKQPATMSYTEKSDIAYKEAVQKVTEMAEKKNVILPLYLYDHSGITMSTGRFSCPWDSGQVGWIYVSHEDIRKEYGWKKLTKKRLETIEKYLTGEVETYDQFIRGDVYGFKLFAPADKAELAADDMTEDDIDEDNIDEYCEEIDSCWGFFGDNWKENGMSDHISIENIVKRRVKKHTDQLKTWIRNHVPLARRTPLAL